ncbi:hypothetical protein [Actinacidiphila cocklensis]|nr:hypothetical protein [Actinacidiphila cocklensis]
MLLAKLNAARRIDWTRACMDASHVKAKKGAKRLAGRRSIEAKRGSKHHLICDGNGISPAAGRAGRPLRRPDTLLGDKGYDSNPNRQDPPSSPAKAPSNLEGRCYKIV